MSSSALFQAIDSRADLSRIRSLLASLGAKASEELSRVEPHSNKLPLYVASEDGNAPLVALLVAHGADANAPCTRAQSTPLHAAAYNARIDAIAALLDAGAAASTPNANAITPLHAACSAAHLDAARALISRGASPAAADRLGATPLHYAAAQHEPALLEALLAAAPRGALLRDKAGLEPAHYAAADAATGGEDADRRDLTRVLALLAAAGSAAAAAGLPALKRTLQDAPDAHRRHIVQVARRDVPAPRVPTGKLAATAAAAPVATVAPVVKGETPMVTNSNAEDVRNQMPSVPGMRKPPKRSDGPEEYASLFDQRGSVASKAPASSADAKLVFVPGDYQEVEGAALPMLGVPDSPPPGSPSVGKLTAKLRGLRKKDDAPAGGAAAATGDEPAKKESISARMKRLKEMARDKLTKSSSGRDKAPAAASAAGAVAYDDGGAIDADDDMSFPDAPSSAGGAAAYADTADATDDFPASPPRAAPQRQTAPAAEPAPSSTGGAAAYNDDEAGAIGDFPSPPPRAAPQRQPAEPAVPDDDDDDFVFPEAPSLDAVESDELAFPSAPTVALPKGGGRDGGGGGGGGGGVAAPAPRKPAAAPAPTMSEERMREILKAKQRAEKAEQGLRAAQQTDAERQRALQSRLARLQPAGAQPADPRADAQAKKAAQDEFLRQVTAYRAANVAHAEKKKELARRKAALDRGDMAGARKNPPAMPSLPSVPSDLPSEPAAPPKAAAKPTPPSEPKKKDEAPKKQDEPAPKKPAAQAPPAAKPKSAEELARERKEQKRFEKFLAENDPDYELSDDEDEAAPKMTNKELNALLKEAAAEMEEDDGDAQAIAAKYATMFAKLAGQAGPAEKPQAQPRNKGKPASAEELANANVDEMDEAQLLKFVQDSEKHDDKILDAMNRFNDRM